MLSRKRIAADLGLSPFTVKIGISRLLQKGLLESLDRHYSCKAGGAVYRVPWTTERALLADSNTTTSLAKPPDQDSEAQIQPGLNQDSEATVVSSSLLTTTTATTPPPAEVATTLVAACNRLGLADHKIGANDLLPLLRSFVFGSLDDLLESLEHLAFYLRTEAARTISKPKAWAMSQLRQGYYAPPAGFLSWEEEQNEKRLAAKRERLKRLEEQRRNEFDTDFEIWLLERAPDQRRALLGNRAFSDSVESPAAISALRQIFADETHRANPHLSDG